MAGFWAKILRNSKYNFSMALLTITKQPDLEAGEHISATIREHVGDLVCLLSGGSALDIIKHIDPYKHCFHQDCKDSDTSGATKTKCTRSECRTIFMMGDERVSGESEINNYLQLVNRYPEHPVTIRTLDTSALKNESEKDFAVRVENIFLETLTKLNNPKILFILGVGTDGHTAGIFPLEESAFRRVYQDDLTYVPVKLEGLKIDSRASFTPNWILNNVDEVIGYVVGNDKKEILSKLSSETKNLNERPAELLNLHKRVHIFTDQDIVEA
jgi:6-phosphogluconolactonase/glucosamine-6-phosphate isomerase/deaminase